MSSSTAPGTFSELYTDLQNRVRDVTSVSATQTIAKRLINIALLDMHVGFGEKFPWCERTAVLVTQPQYTTGTVTITQGSTSLTGTSTAWTTSNVFGAQNARTGGKVTIGGSAEVYDVTVVSGTSITLGSRFVTADLTDGSYCYFEDEYALASDFLRPIDQRSFSDAMEIELIGRTEFRRRYPRNNIPGRPVVATILDKPVSGNTTPVRKIQFHRPPDIAYSIPYTYVTSNLATTISGTAQAALVNDTDEPIVPIRYRQAIVLNALYNWYRDRRDDARAADVKAEYVDFISRMVGDDEIGDRRPRIIPESRVYAGRARRPWRSGGSSSRFDLGHFDEMGE